MPGKLILMDDSFFADLEAGTQDMQFSGDNREAVERLRRILKEHPFPQTWTNLLRWPVQCGCGHAMEFAVLYYVAKMHCPLCHAPIGAPDLHAELNSQVTDLMRYRMLVANIDDMVFAFGGKEAQALRALTRMTNDADLLAETADEMNTTTCGKYKRK